VLSFTPNKKGKYSGSMEQLFGFEESWRKKRGVKNSFLTKTNVAQVFQFINTLQDLMLSGDKVISESKPYSVAR